MAIQKSFAELIYILGRARSNKAKDMANEYWLLFTENKLKAVEMSTLLECIDNASFDNFVYNSDYIDARYITKKITKLLIDYENLNSRKNN
jgi:hypothetical protein